VKGHGIKVALVEPGIIDTAMATTNLPQYDKGTIYPMGAESMHSSTPATAVTPAVVVRDAEPSPLGLRR